MPEMFQLTQPLGCFKRNFIFQPEVTAPHSAHPPCMLDTLAILCHMSVWALGARLSFEIYMQGNIQQIYRTTPVHTHKKHLWLGHYAALRSLPLGEVAHGEVLGTGWLQLGTENWGTMFTWWAVITIQKHKAQALVKAKMGIKQTIHCEVINWNDC